MAAGFSAVERTEEREPARQERLGGARADFVANLGRRGAEISAMLRVLSTDPNARVGDDLRRRIHALAAGARLLRFTRLAESLAKAEARLEALGSTTRPGGLALGPDDLEYLKGVVAEMPSLAWGQVGPEEPDAPRGMPVEPTGDEDARVARLRQSERVPIDLPPPPTAWPTTVLVVGAPTMAEALAPSGETLPSDRDDPFEVERTDDTTVAIDLARALAPDVVVVDGELPGARALIEALAADPLTEPVPVVVLGRFRRPEDAGPFLALGVAKALPKPASPGALRRACAEVTSSYVRREIVREPLGELSVDELGARLAEELRRGLCDAADAKGRGQRIDLGEGTEVLAALWGAVARVRDVVTIKSGGNVRYAAGGPEGAIPLAPWLGDEPRADKLRSSRPSEARVATDASLEGTTILVADDDPAVGWFLGGVLKAAGATVHEARDGARALDIAQHVTPDLVITDILMPGLDGFALCRALKRDVVLRDVPVILLSWKEDLLQRVRELGADADGYLRKEASAGAIVQRVRELLRRRRRVAERIACGTEVRGRLDGLTTRTLLGLACRHRPSSTVSVRDASFLYEVEIRDARPIRATRTASDGTFQRGPSVLAALLGVGDGRFVVTAHATSDPIRADLLGTLEEQLVPAVAAARAAQRLLFGEALVRVDRVDIDDDRLSAYLEATPEPARSLLRSIANGASPRALIVDGRAPARLLEDVLCDAAAHGAVVGVVDTAGEDLLFGAVNAEIARLQGVSSVPGPIPAPELVVAEGSLLAQALAVDPFADDADLDAEVGAPDEDPDPSGPRLLATEAPAAPGALATQPAPGDLVASGEPRERSTTPIAGGAAEVHGPISALFESPAPHAPAATLPELSPPAPRAKTPKPSTPKPSTPKPAQAALPPPVAEEPVPRTPTPTPAELPPPPGLKPLLTLGSLTPPPVLAQPLLERFTRKDVTPRPAVVAEAPRPPRAEAEPTYPRPSAYAPTARTARREPKVLMWIGFAVCGVAFAFWARWMRESSVVPEPVPAAAVDAELAPEEAAAAAMSPLPPEPPQQEVASDGPPDAPAEDLPLRDGDKVKKNEGMLEVVCGQSDTVYVDGKLVGSGPVARLALKAKDDPYEVRVKLRGEERVRFVVVTKGRLARVRVAPPWAR